MTGSCWRKIISSWLATRCCTAGMRLDFQVFRSRVALPLLKCSQLPVGLASVPGGMNAFLERLAWKKPYAEPREATCQRSVGAFVEKAFGYQSPQDGSSLTFESIPIACRFFVMIWFEATQSDQPEMTWMSSLTRLPFGSMRSPPL